MILRRIEMTTEKSVSAQPASMRVLRRIVVAAALGALTVFLGVTRLGILPWFSGASLTILYVPVLVGALLEGPVVGAAIGAIFGAYSLVQAYISPAGIVDLAFQNPLVALPPRMAFPIIAWLIYLGLSFLFKKAGEKFALIAVPISSFIGSLVHTGLVLSVLGLVVGPALVPEGSSGITVASVLLATFVANGIPEAIAAAVFVTVIISIWTGISTRRRSRLSEIED